MLRPVVPEVMSATFGVRPTANIDAGVGIAAVARQQTTPADIMLGLEMRRAMHALMANWAPPPCGRDRDRRKHRQRGARQQAGVDDLECASGVRCPSRLL